MSKKPETKKKKNYRLRKSVRRTFGALFMISAIIVAAIPFPDSAAADVSGGGVGGQTAPKLVSYTFNTDSANPVDGASGPDKEDNISKHNGGVAMVKKGEAETKQALTTRQGTSGAYTIYKQFDFAEASFKDGGAQGTFGYITEYNTTYVTDKTVALTELAATSYVLIEEADYNAFYANGAAKITFDQNKQDVVEKFEQFFKDHTDYQSYQQKYKQWQDGGMAGEAPKAETATGQPITIDPDTFLNDSNKRDYYLFSKHRPYYTEGYRMVPVIDKRNPTNSDNVTIYLLQGGQPPQGKFNDDNGFLIDGTSSIIGIGNNAFEGVVNVDNITLPKEIKYIGDEAFKNSFIKTLKLDGISAIGYSAFEGCSELSTVELAGLETICSAAFMNCTNLSSVTLPYSVSKIGKGAFAGCLKLDNLDLSQVSTTNNATIGEAAFYNCSLGGLNMGEASFQTVEKGAFATTSPGTDNMVKVDMSGTGITTFADQVFSGRGKLQEVTMPRNYGATSKATLPTNTFVGCANLSKVLFPDSSTQVVYESDGIFFDVRNEQFVVEGPATDSAGANAAERTATWDTFTSIVLGTDEQGNPIYNPVPYTYQKDGVYYYEVKSGDYILSLDIDPATNTATVASCNYAEGIEDSANGALNIPATVGPYAVTKLGNDCFPQKLKEDLTTIQNHSLLEIGDNVFQGCTKLTGVTFGDSLQTIGSNAFQGCTSLDTVVLGGGITQIKDSAFAGCTKLTNITFGAPLQGAASFPRENIGVNALSTGSNNLTVTGIIEDGYGPLEWAMDPQNYVKQEDGVRVLYKSPEPQSLSIILDNRNNLVTLLDYPHYGDINPDVRRKFENGDALTPAEEAAVNAALYVDIPAPIESIDAKGYLNNEKINGQNVPSNNLNITYYFSNDPRYTDYAKYGLFNGEFVGKHNDDAEDIRDIGNDRVRSVTMHTVKYLPNSSAAISNDVLSDNGLAGGAFYSCGNLETVSLGSAMENVGSLPFLGAHRLSSVASGTEKYVCNNKILYENLPDGTKKVVEVLGSRGNANDRHITVENDPDLASVSAMAVGAVSDVPELTMVDFTGNELLREIPDKAFLASKELSDVVLPNSIRTIGLKSFAENGNIRVSILGREISLATDAFENTQDAIVFAYDDSAAFNTAKKIASLYSNVDVRALNDVFRVQFFDYDGVTELTEVQYVERGDSADLPDEDPVRPGYIFTGWNKSHKDIQADTVILALYDVDPKNPGGLGPVGGGVSNNNGTTSGNTVPGGVDTNGDGVPDVDKDGNKLYSLTVTGGNGSGRYAAGTKVSIMATGGATGSAFGNWSSSDASVIFDDSTKAITTLIMPAKDTTVIANYAGQYRLEVKYGSGSGSYAAGTKVAISAVEPPAGKKFYRWTSPTTGLTIESSSSTSTTITMPASNATIEATYSNTGGGTGGGSSSPTNTPTTTQTPSKNKTSVIITRPGISDTGQASAYVSGSTDGFVVKISQSAEADAAALAALEAEYGDMTPIKFAAMDISLYDSTGTTKITNTTGLKINITMPIPDALRPYAGNNKIAAASNNRLEKLGVKFITMNGVPCMSFTATHFSPYVVYVDTGNLAAGNVLDQTPKTGDGIHPKWFLSIGLASISMILFLKKDSKPRYKTKVS